MNREKLERMIAGIESWKDNFGEGMENRGVDGASWYDLSLLNALPCEKKICIVVTAWSGQLKWLKNVLTQYRLSGAFVLLSYDNPFYAWVPPNEYEVSRSMPNQQHYLLANAFVSKHITYDCDKRNGWFWNVRYAQGVLKSFPNIEYVYITNGDCVCENPKGFEDVIKLLGDDDLIAGQSNDSIIHTATMFMKIEAFNKVTDYMYNIMRVPVIGSRSPEVMVREAVNSLGIRVKHCPKQPLDRSDGSVDMYARYDQESTWKELLGFKNLFAIQETKGNEGREPLDKKYIDDYLDYIYFSGEEHDSVCKFYKTGDRRYLYMWLDRWEDSDYNRIYSPLDYWSKEPVYDRADDAKFYRPILD